MALKLLIEFPSLPLLFVFSYFRVFVILCRLPLRIPLVKRPAASYINRRDFRDFGESRDATAI